MKLTVCPHCGSRRIAASRVPKDVVVVLPCPACHELVVLYRDKAAALNREVLERGSLEQRRNHIADIVMEFLEPGMFPFQSMEMSQADEDDVEHDLNALSDMGKDGLSEDDDEDEVDETAELPITQREIDRFVKLELHRIDDSAYFRKHFS